MTDKDFCEVSKERLCKIIESKLRTTFIGNLSCFQEEFSDILDDKDFKQSWEITRKKILDNGNNNIRALMKELRQYEIRWTGEKTNFKIGGCDDGR